MKLIKKMTSVLAAGVILSAFAVSAGAETGEAAEETGDFGVWTDIAGADGTTYNLSLIHI